MFGLLLVFTAAFHFLPALGTPLHSDVSWVYRLQIAHDPMLARAIPFGLETFGARPMGLVEACIAHYESFGRWNCADVAFFRMVAWLAQGSADGWRLMFLFFNVTALTLFTLTCRALDVPRSATLVLVAGLAVAPLEVWTTYRTSEPKAAIFLMLALWLAVRERRTWHAWAAALAMLLAVLIKEPMVAAWPAVIAGTLHRSMTRTGQGLLDAARRTWQTLTPHVVAAGILVAWVLALAATSTVRHSYPFMFAGEYAPPSVFIERYAAALAPALLRDHIALLGVAMVAAVAATAARSPQIRARLRSDYSASPLVILLAGLLASVILHGAIHWVTRRLIDDSRYVVPANYLAALAIGIAVTPMLRSLPVAARRVLQGAAATAIVYGFFVHRPPAVELAVLAAVAAALVAAAGVVARTVLPRPPATSILGASVLCVLLLVPRADEALDAAAAERCDLQAWENLVDRLVAEAPRHGHVVLRYAEPFMIEHAWGLETNTLLRGRLDLTYHLTVADSTPYAREAGLLRYAVDAFNAGRAPLPSSPSAVMIITADRTGRARSTRSPAHGGEALRLLVRSPATFYHDRYVKGRAPYLRYTMRVGEG